MTITYDPTHPTYLDEADVRAELTRVYDHCQRCRLCIDHCASFPTLFDLLDRSDTKDAGLLTPAEQDRVVDACFQCSRCSHDCPYTPDRHEWQLDFPRLMVRAKAMQWDQGIVPARSRVTTTMLGRVDVFGALASAWAPVVNRVVTASPGSLIRRALAAITGVSARRRLAPFSAQRFSAWFDQRPNVLLGDRQGRVTIFPTCLVEYQATSIGKDLVMVYERNGIECDRTTAGCCGAPSLHAGDLDRFTKIADRNVARLADEIRAGTDVVVPQPTCADVVRAQYQGHVSAARRNDAELVSTRTFDAVEYLMRISDADDSMLDTDFARRSVERVTYHLPGPAQGGAAAARGRDLLMLTGAYVTVVQQGSGSGGMWGLRADNEPVALPLAARLGERVEAAAGETVVGDCHLANTAIAEQTGQIAQHPLEAIARAYGVHDPP